jgi:uncharacterized membrane protein
VNGPLTFLALFGLAIVLGRVFVRLDKFQRQADSLRDRIARMEKAPQPFVPPEGGSHEPSVSESSGVRLQAEAPVPQQSLPPEGGSHEIERGVLPPEGGRHEIEREARKPQAEGPTPPAEAPESLESQIGTQWLLYIGVIAIVIGVAYFEKLAIDNQWIGETARVIQGAVLGLVLIVVGARFVRSGYALYGQMICGGGAAILYVSTYAAFNFYHLIDRPVAFVLMAVITAMVAWLADRQLSQGLALFAVGGGFATPFLLPGTTDAQMALFGYDAILIGGTLLLSRRRDWPVLNIVSYVFTLFTVAGWADRFYTPAKYLQTELFLTLFCAMFLGIVRACHRSKRPAAELSALVLWTAPAVYYLASVLILQQHPTAMLVWLVCLMLVGGILSARVGAATGLTVWAGVALPLLHWCLGYGGPAWLVPGLATVAGIYLIALAANLHGTMGRDEPSDLGPADIAWLHLNGLATFAAAYFLIDPISISAIAEVAAGFALWQGVLAAIVVKHQRDQALHFVALGFTLLTIAVALQFDGPVVTVAWATEGTVVIALGLRERRAWLRVGGVLLLALAVERAVAMLFTDAPVNQVVLLNPRAACAAWIATLCYLLAWLHYRDPEAPDRDFGIGAALVTAQVVVLSLLTSEINAYWAVREGHFARELMMSATWGVYATVLILIGLIKRYAPIRYFAMIVFAVTIVKVFAVDMAELDRIYRVSSILGLGILLLVTSYLYNRSKRT